MGRRRLFPPLPSEQLLSQDDADCVAALLQLEYVDQAHGQPFMEEDEADIPCIPFAATKQEHDDEAAIIIPCIPFSAATQEQHDARRALFLDPSPNASPAYTPPPVPAAQLNTPPIPVNTPQPHLHTSTPPFNTQPPSPVCSPIISPRYSPFSPFIDPPYTEEEKKAKLAEVGRERLAWTLVENQESAAALGFLDFPPFYRQWRTFADVDFYYG